MPDAATIDAAMTLVKSCFPGSDWFISETPDFGVTRAKNVAYNQDDLRRVCNKAARIERGVHDYSFSCASRAFQIHVEFERVKLDRSMFDAILGDGGIRTSAVHIHFSTRPASSLAHLMRDMASILSAFYGRIFLPRDVVRRQTGSYHTLGGLPGLHPVNFFGRCIADRIDIDAVKAIPNVNLRDESIGLLVEFVGRVDEFSKMELDALEPVFGASLFRKFANSELTSRQEQVLPWLLKQFITGRRHKKDAPIFDCDPDPLFL